MALDDQAEEAAIRSWWDEWWTADYSWQGLSEKEIYSGGAFGERTLQDFWRRDPHSKKQRSDAEMVEAGELIEFDGRTWHVVHLPARSRDGAETSWKAAADQVSNWTDLEQLIAVRLVKSTPTADGAPDGHCQLQGAVIRGAISLPDAPMRTLSAKCEQVAHLEAAIFDGSNTNFHRLSYRKALFVHSCSFLDVNFLGSTFFSGAVFCEGLTTFAHTRFEWVSFQDCTFFGSTLFRDATFEGPADFRGAHFVGAAGFEGSRFLNDALFATHFQSEANFPSSTFEQKAYFDTALFGGEAYFRDTKFAQPVIFQGTEFLTRALFWGALFSDYADFSGAKFRGDATFGGATFKNDARFQDGEFFADAGFEMSDFQSSVYFDGRRFSGRVNFHQATFGRLASFREIAWPASAAEWQCAFEGAVFEGSAAFERSGFRCFAAFDGATFERVVRLDDASEADAAKTFYAELTAASQEGLDREAQLRALEKGSRVLKGVMEKAGNRTREQQMYRFELRARRAQHSTPRWEKIASVLYAAFSDYGNSIFRPIAVLSAVTLVMGLVYFVWAGWLTESSARYVAGQFPEKVSKDFWSALTFSASTIFRPLSVWSNEYRSEFWQATFFSVGDGWRFLIRVVATLQTFLSGALIFLFGLAIRRKFQISG